MWSAKSDDVISHIPFLWDVFNITVYYWKRSIIYGPLWSKQIEIEICVVLVSESGFPRSSRPCVTV